MGHPIVLLLCMPQDDASCIIFRLNSQLEHDVVNSNNSNERDRERERDTQIFKEGLRAVLKFLMKLFINLNLFKSKLKSKAADTVVKLLSTPRYPNYLARFLNLSITELFMNEIYFNYVKH